MYIPAHFQVEDPAALHALIRQHPLGMLVTHTDEGLDANHIPFELLESADGHVRLLAHVARANPVWQQISEGQAALVVFRAEEAYISPNWFPSKHEAHKQVPTWNYRVVHVHGSVHVHQDEKFLRGVLARLTRTHEQHTQTRAPQAHPAWKMTDAEPAYLQQMLGAIVGIEICVSRMEGKFKLSQNRSAQDQQGAAEGLAQVGEHAMAALMQPND